MGNHFRFKLGILTVCLVCLLGSQINPALAQGISEVKLEVNAPFSTAAVIINHQGQIGYSANSPKTGIDKLSDASVITQDQFRELDNLINENNFFLLEEKYIEDGLEDATTYTVTVKKSGQAKTVSCYGRCPEQINKIIAKIKELWGKEILTVGV